MTDFFFIRHGATKSNLEHRIQTDTEPLCSKGITQARLARAVVQDLNPTHLVTSNLTRARETAGIIVGNSALKPDTNVLFREVDRPAHLHGLKYLSPSTINYIFNWVFNGNQSYWKEIGGESLTDVNLRLAEAKHYLESMPTEAKVVVVSHSCFITYFSIFARKNRPMSKLRALILFVKVKLLKNTSSTHLSFNHETGKWRKVK